MGGWVDGWMGGWVDGWENFELCRALTFLKGILNA